MANTVLTLVELGSYTASFYSDSLDVLLYKEADIEFDISNVSGTNPTLDIIIEQQSGLNSANWNTLYTLTQKTTTGISTVYIPNATQFGFAANVRAHCTIGGTNSPTFTFSIVIVAKE